MAVRSGAFVGVAMAMALVGTAHAAPRAKLATPEEVEAYVARRPDPLKPLARNLYTGGERNAVLNFNRIGLAAMEIGDYQTAEASFDAALVRIEAVFTKDNRAKAAKSIFGKESNKDWRGEPYERAMAYYYRGLLYLRAGDYGNARASFKSAEYQDSVSEYEEFQADFGVMNYLIGWATRCMGDDPRAEFEYATKAQADLVEPPKDHNLLMIAELGAGPTKAREGGNKEKLVFRATEGFPETMAFFSLPPEMQSAAPSPRGRRGAAAAVPAPAQGRALQGQTAASILYQATTRGGRPIDGILKGKANLKTGTTAVAGGLLAGGAMVGGDTGAYMALGGLALGLLGGAMKAEADIRYWDQLPDLISIATARVPGDPDVDVSFSGPFGQLTLPPVPMMQARAGKCSIAWTRSRSALRVDDAPGDDVGVRMAVARKDAARNVGFRAELEGGK